MAEKRIPLRKCTGCGVSKDKRQLIRVVRTPEGEVVFDPTGKGNGRGAYVCRNAECFRKARKTKGLDRSFRRAVPMEIYELLEKEFLNFESAK